VLAGGVGLRPSSGHAQVDVACVRSEATRADNLPFSDAVRVGHMLYLSGQVGSRPGDSGVVPGGIQPPTRR
jgi:enamine deaminase RidA (YjgF/YER057c/UK114 family)